jgi:hypothetical protein
VVYGPENSDTIGMMNQLAWTMATSDSPEIRNGTNAVRLATEAVAATQRKNPGYLDTLAAAYAETQRFDTAVAAQLEAMGLLRNEQEQRDYASRLRLYQAHQPCRELRSR